MDTGELYGRGLLGGLVAGAVVSGLLAIARAGGLPLALEELLGRLVVEHEHAAVIVGFLMHLVASGLFGALYAALMGAVWHRSNGRIGALLGLVHAGLSGVLLGLLPLVHPAMPERMSEPGFFASELGPAAVIGLFLAHTVFGIIVGAVVGAGYPAPAEVERPA